MGCGSDIINEPNLLCLECFDALSYTHFAEHADNPVEKIFWGRLPLESATSQFYFSKGTVIQKLIHQLKYKNNRDAGIFLGGFIGRSILSSKRFPIIDAIIPLPLFADKERRRGYNQAEILCRGIAEELKIPVITGNVIRKKYTDTQTKKGRSERWENVEGSFEVLNPHLLSGKHILLVDDVVTTGATLEACGAAILKVAEVQISIATVAYASK